MARPFALIAFTPNVQRAQTSMGSRTAYRQFEVGEVEDARLGPHEIEFVRQRDSFYQATVGESGWPYMQHRGGPPGFLQVLDDRTLGYADFSGNRQYISLGNLQGDSRVSLFLMDYAQQRRLKIWGRVRFVDEAKEPELIARLETPTFRAPVERGVLIHIDAFDWNCPKYITPRYTRAEAERLLPSNAEAARPSQSSTALGTGPLTLTVTGIRQITPTIRAFELRSPDWKALPLAGAGSYIVVPVHLPDGTIVSRQYSLTSHETRPEFYEIAVNRDDTGRGGSKALHASWQLGTVIRIEPPKNQFALHEDGRPAVLIAGGIGITPIIAMAQALSARGSRFESHYSARSPSHMAFRDRLEAACPDGSHLYFTQGPEGKRMDPTLILRRMPHDAVVYVCGPEGLINAVRHAAGTLEISPDRIQFERFE